MSSYLIPRPSRAPTKVQLERTVYTVPPTSSKSCAKFWILLSWYSNPLNESRKVIHASSGLNGKANILIHLFIVFFFSGWVQFSTSWPVKMHKVDICPYTAVPLKLQCTHTSSKATLLSCTCRLYRMGATWDSEFLKRSWAIIKAGNAWFSNLGHLCS